MEKLSPVDEETPTIELAVPVSSAREPASSNERNRPSAKDSKILESNIVERNDSVQIAKKPLSNTSVRNIKQTPILKLGQGLGKSKIQTPLKRPIGELTHYIQKATTTKLVGTIQRNKDISFNPLTLVQGDHVHLKIKLEPDEWIKDSGCSRHMTDNKDLFSTYEAINE
ncbi:hypothetical protein Tco_0049892, partial [Tanacetum coccineum]